MHIRRSVAVAIGLGAVMALHAPLHAQETLSVDFYQGPVINSHRSVGLGGALTGVAEGADSHLNNPAAFAVRPSYTADEWFDWDATASFFTLDARSETDIDRSGRSGAFDSAEYAQLGFNLKFGRHGFGLQVQGHTYDLLQGGVDTTTYEQTFAGLGYAYVLGDGSWTVGGMATFGNASINQSGEELLAIEGSGVQVGGLWAPCGQQYRLGGSFRTEILALSQNNDTIEFQGEEVAFQLTVPAELRLGVSAMLGPRPYNVCPTFGAWEDKGLELPERILQRFYVLLTADLVVTAPVRGGTGAQAFLADEVQPSGKKGTASVRGGIESEVMDNRLVLRAGTYYEPSRFDETSGRQHLTGGFDVRIFEFIWDLEISGAFDFADQYTNFGLGLGLWH